MVNTKRNSKKKFHPPFEKKKSGLFSFLLFFLCLCVFKKLKRKAVYADMRTYWSSTHTHTGEKPMQSTMYIFFSFLNIPTGPWQMRSNIKTDYIHTTDSLYSLLYFLGVPFSVSLFISLHSRCVCVCVQPEGRAFAHRRFWRQQNFRRKSLHSWDFSA